MKHIFIPSVLLGSAALLALTNSSHAAIVVTNTPQNSAFEVSSTDLLQAAGTTHINRNAAGDELTDTDSLFTRADGSDTTAGVSVLTDGAFGVAGGTPTSRAASAGIAGQDSSPFLSITYTFNTTINAFGYNLSEINIYTGWNDNGRDNPEYNLLYSTISAPDTFLQLASVNYTDGPGNVPASIKSSVTDTTSFVAQGVKSVRFEFPRQENDWVAYRELDVIGVAAVPEPTSAMMLGIGTAGLIGMIRRRKA
ncbi:MAG TPA: PEP-CTERM sorting domain-containing protein [Chthoniobacteraceae bacterium]|jgi:hypothetical protein